MDFATLSGPHFPCHTDAHDSRHTAWEVQASLHYIAKLLIGQQKTVDN